MIASGPFPLGGALGSDAFGAGLPAPTGPAVPLARRGGPPGARERILAASFGLFANRGIRDVGVDELILASGVAKATFYKHFGSKDALALAYLEQWYRERGEAIERAVLGCRAGSEAAILAVFDVFDGWFREGSAEVSSSSGYRSR